MPEQLPLATEARARRTDPGTSHAAAKSIAELGKLQRAVLKALKALGPATDAHLVEFYFDEADSFARWPMQSASGIRTRRRELTDAGLVEDTGRKAKLRSGRRAIVWQAKP